ncbi:Type II phosphatidylinositol 4,5-bisphosphate 4-phosphatase [Acipenser ruthenus]|uniref:Phosphatidylinositol-4,5-bisphosphate 4-phosphatase n=1 Tax=Acipenser ruthenus TaxID=7906 RepID=A0A662YX03_ACIRT|nr:Type II phosphatidylinositol 4,5-bisphosphate 4-phosphatase [Acipenser ruthenus]
MAGHCCQCPRAAANDSIDRALTSLPSFVSQCCYKDLNNNIGRSMSTLPSSTELPPPYTAIASPEAGGVPVINCRVCQSLINLDGKLHQHVVKCTVCNEATIYKLQVTHKPLEMPTSNGNSSGKS